MRSRLVLPAPLAPRTLRDQAREQNADLIGPGHLSMGMSGDYEAAIEQALAALATQSVGSQHGRAARRRSSLGSVQRGCSKSIG